MDEYKGNFERGDFLISTVGVPIPQTGYRRGGSRPRRSDVQFHVRDAETVTKICGNC